MGDKVQVKTYQIKYYKNTHKHVLKNLFKNEAYSFKSDKSVGYEAKDYTTGDYQIAICQDGKFAVTFDTANLRIKILQNRDYRPPKFGKSKRYGPDDDSNGSSEIDIPSTNETVADFQINDDFTIKVFYKSNKSSFFNQTQNKQCNPKNNTDEESEESSSNEDKKGEPSKWSFDISNMHKTDGKSFILVAISRINVDEDMKGTKEKKHDNKTSEYEPEVENTEINVITKTTDQIKKGIAIYRVEVEEKESKGENLDDIKDSENENKKGIADYRVEVEENKNKCPSNENLDNDIKGLEDQNKKGIAINRIEYKVSAVTCYYSNEISGICKFIEVSSEDDLCTTELKQKQQQSSQQQSPHDPKLKRFIILNFHMIYNFNFNDQYDPFELNEEFEYPKSFRHELDNFYTRDFADARDSHDLHVDDDSYEFGGCMKRLLSCIYDKYFLVTQYKSNVRSLEVYNLAKMELKTAAKKCETKDEPIKQQLYSDKFSVSRLHLCYTQGINIINLFYMENGLRITSKKFDEIKQIYLLEFIDSDEKLFIIGECEGKIVSIIWDIYNTAEYEPIELDNFPINKPVTIKASLARTSGNILQIENNGRIYSVLEKVENKLEECKKEKIGKKEPLSCFVDGKKMICAEPWMLDKYDEIPHCLYHNKEGERTETLQLIVGRSTVQIWHQINSDDENIIDKDDLPNKGEPFLGFIWTNRMPIDQEREKTGLRIEQPESYGSPVTSNGSHDTLNDKLNGFYLKVYWYERKVQKDKKESANITEEDEEIDEIEKGNKDIKKSEKVKRKEKVIEKKDIIEKFHAIRHACRALEHLNKRFISNRLANNYIRIHKYEKIIGYIKHIIWKFAKYEPEIFKLLCVRYNLMKNLILSDCDHLIKFILFGDEKLDDCNKVFKGQKEVKTRYIPSNELWPGKKFLIDDDLYFNKGNDKLEDNEEIEPKNNMELAIYHCKGRELKDTIIIAYLLEYYSRHATDCAGWMCTVSKAIPLLFKYNYDDYARKLFFKECFANQDHFSVQDPNEIIPPEYLARRNHDIKFRAFRPMVRLKSNKIKWYDYIRIKIKSLKSYIIKNYENYDNDLGKSPLALRVVPLPNFTVNSIENDKKEYNWIKDILYLLWFIFLPRWYQIKRDDRTKLSPFSRMIHYENNDDIYDNPATEAVINFRWQKAKNFFILLFFRFLIFAICFVLVSRSYLKHGTTINRKFLLALIVIFYYLAIYQLITEVLQLKYRGFKKYFGDIFNLFDIISIVLSVTMMSIMLESFQFSDGFKNVKEINNWLIVGISFSIFFLWIELILFLRLLSSIGIYIYYSVIIFKAIFPFFLFILIVIVAFAHTMFVLLRDPTNIRTKDSTYSGNATNVITNETLIVKLKSDFDPQSNDNPFSTFLNAIVTTYFWIGDNWVQRDEFDFWAIDVFTLIASVILIVLLMNMLIAFMTGVYEKAETKGRQTLLRRRANHIADYEALYHIHFWSHEPEPKHIYYFGQSKAFEEWYAGKGDQGAIYKDFEEKSTFTKQIFERRNYDDHSIWDYDIDIDNIESEIKKIKTKKNRLNNRIKKLSKKINDPENEKKIKKIQNNIYDKIRKVDNIKIKKMEWDGRFIYH
ncbi:unnamed protein product [Rhizophagus irregularis]|uniref:Ion transport domain-containing protein n=1 Tax=Rhizophagus irregularis TaxID=588596 RepID=A0A915ZTR0_9GLOM|nr:unnamed protein product [Rhizophagus irregularis]